MKTTILHSKRIRQIVITLLLPALMYVIFSLAAPGRFGGANSMYGILQQSIVPAIFGFGLMFNMSVGNWDFSLAATATLAGILAASACESFGLAGMVVVAIVSSIVLYCITGAIYSLLKIPSIVVTIGMLLIYEALGTMYNDGQSYNLAFEDAILGRAPYIFIIGIASMALAYVIFNKTKFGMQVLATGNHEGIASQSGINPEKVKFWCFVICGLFVGIAALVQLSYNGAIIPKKNMQTMSIVFNSLMGVFIGMYLSDVCNRMIGVFIGTFIITMLNTGLIAIGMDGTWQQVFTGGALVLLISVSENKTKLIQLFRRRKVRNPAQPAHVRP